MCVFSRVMALGTKLFLSLFVLDFMHLYRPPRAGGWTDDDWGVKCPYWCSLLCSGTASWGERAADDLLSRLYNSLQPFPVPVSAASIPRWDAVCKHALNAASVEGLQQHPIQVVSSEYSKEVESLLGLLNGSWGVWGPGEISRDVGAKIFVHILWKKVLWPKRWTIKRKWGSVWEVHLIASHVGRYTVGKHQTPSKI